MESIKILIIGKHDWIERLSSKLDKMEETFVIEKIENEDAAVQRLKHNSYNILLIQDQFSKINPIKLASLAYAMTRPSIILCSNRLRYMKFKVWQFCSRFARKFKTSRVLINFNFGSVDLEKQITTLANDYMNYFDKVNEEIKSCMSKI